MLVIDVVSHHFGFLSLFDARLTSDYHTAISHRTRTITLLTDPAHAAVFHAHCHSLCGTATHTSAGSEPATGPSRGIRTRNICVPNAALYQVELYPDTPHLSILCSLYATCCAETYARGLHSPLRSSHLVALSLTSMTTFAPPRAKITEDGRMRHGTFQHTRPKPVVFRSTLFRVLTAFHGRPHGRCTACAPSQSTIWRLYWPNSAGTLFGKHLLSIASSTGGTPSRVGGIARGRTETRMPVMSRVRYLYATIPQIYGNQFDIPHTTSLLKYRIHCNAFLLRINCR